MKHFSLFRFLLSFLLFLCYFSRFPIPVFPILLSGKFPSLFFFFPYSINSLHGIVKIQSFSIFLPHFPFRFFAVISSIPFRLFRKSPSLFHRILIFRFSFSTALFRFASVFSSVFPNFRVLFCHLFELFSTHFIFSVCCLI